MKKTARGFTLIETLIASALLFLLFSGILIVLQLVLRTIGQARVTVVASSLAQEKLEIAKNLPFTEVGTVGGVPPGSLAQTETVSVNGQDFLVSTGVFYIDDPFDGLSPTDSIPTDYKRVRVLVDWEGTFKPKKPLVMSTDIAPEGIEFIDNAGTLRIGVFNSQGEPVANALVHIVASSVSPPVDLNTTTNVDGTILLPGVLACTECYEITVTKNGYSTDLTYSSVAVANPQKPHATVLEGELTEVSFAIDFLSTLTVRTTRSRQSGYSLFPGVQFTLKGNKIVGTNTLDEPQYKYSVNHVTGALGQVVIPNLEWDSYEFLLPAGSSIDIAGINPLLPFPVFAGGSSQLLVTTTANTQHSLLASVKSDTGAFLPGASITLFDQGSVVATASAGLAGYGDVGQAYFGNLSAKTYDLLVTLAGYSEATGSVSINGDIWEHIILSGI